MWTRAIEGLVHRGTVVMSMRKTRGSRPNSIAQSALYMCAMNGDHVSGVFHIPVESRLVIATRVVGVSWIEWYASPSSIALAVIIEGDSCHHHSLPQLSHFNASLARLRAPSRVLFPAISGLDMREKCREYDNLPPINPEACTKIQSSIPVSLDKSSSR